ncbi:FCD domain-containing protein [Paenibacillus sp. LMG 31461]|uniref:FCD domain-containing protein n=1 Tax=Paenibacillus plantarum TaxID=2654975 RepID=A0ABX1X288_9BACL|nr:FCD domain-containing protein [Paenibacillus plantarum]NOU62497.1 FCD domain-containing protein [Paenibacillus plantarum]
MLEGNLEPIEQRKVLKLMKTMAYETAIQAIKEKIKTGEWKAGDRLPTVQQLAVELSLGISTVREALRILENQRIVSIEHGRGMYLRNDPLLLEDPTTTLEQLGNISLVSLLEARLLIEPELASLCAKHATDSQIQQLRYLADQMVVQMQKGGDFFETDMAFHQLIAEGSNNPVLIRMMSMIAPISVEARKQTNTIPNMRTKASNYHILIAIAIEERHAEQAKLLMEAHIREMLRMFIQ